MVQSTNKIQENHELNSLDAELAKIFSTMSESLKVEVLHYAKYLLDREPKKIASPELSLKNDDIPKKKYREAGTMAGMIITSDDFDEPLEELQEYL